jgi:hypothetical protein
MMTKQLICAAVLAAAAVVGMVAPTAAADPTPTPSPGIPDTGAKRAGIPRRPGLSAPVPPRHAGVRVQVRPWHWDVGPGSGPVVNTSSSPTTRSGFSGGPARAVPP